MTILKKYFSFIQAFKKNPPTYYVNEEKKYVLKNLKNKTNFKLECYCYLQKRMNLKIFKLF